MLIAASTDGYTSAVLNMDQTISPTAGSTDIGLSTVWLSPPSTGVTEQIRGRTLLYNVSHHPQVSLQPVQTTSSPSTEETQ